MKLTEKKNEQILGFYYNIMQRGSFAVVVSGPKEDMNGTIIFCDEARKCHVLFPSPNCHWKAGSSFSNDLFQLRYVNPQEFIYEMV